jgi:hypothetical protein
VFPAKRTVEKTKHFCEFEVLYGLARLSVTGARQCRLVLVLRSYPRVLPSSGWSVGLDCRFGVVRPYAALSFHEGCRMFHCAQMSF